VHDNSRTVSSGPASSGAHSEITAKRRIAAYASAQTSRAAAGKPRVWARPPAKRRTTDAGGRLLAILSEIALLVTFPVIVWGSDEARRARLRHRHPAATTAIV